MALTLRTYILSGILVLYLILDILLLGPFLVHQVSVVDPTVVSGFVTSSRSLDINLPEPVALLIHSPNNNLSIVKRLSPEENYAIVGGPRFVPGTFLIAKSYASWFVDYRDIGSERFGQLIVTSSIKSTPSSQDVSVTNWIAWILENPVGYSGSVEGSLDSSMGQLLFGLATLFFYLGPLALVVFAYLEGKQVRIWGFVAMGSLYTLHILLQNFVASTNGAQVSLTSSLVGYSTFGFFILGLLVYRYEVIQRRENILSRLFSTKKD